MLLLVAAMVTPGPAPAQSSGHLLRIQARIESGEPIASASVHITETGATGYVRALRTDRDGRVEASVPSGSFRIKVDPPAPGLESAPPVGRTLYAVSISSAREVDVTLPRGRLVDTAVVASDGRPLASARVDVYSESLEPVATVAADAAGWVRFAALPSSYVFVTPPPNGGRELPRWCRADEIGEAGGMDRPIVLELPEPAQTIAPDITRLFEGTLPGRRFSVAIVSEGYTDGEEPFVDVNGNGKYDGEPFLDENGDGKWQRGEPFVDLDGNQRPELEPFTDLNGDGVCNRGERERFLRAATDAARCFLGLPVYRGRRDAIDVYAIFAPSRQAGSDVVSAPVEILRDTAFGSRFYYPAYTADVDTASATAYARERVQADVVVVVTNDLHGLGRAFAASAVALFARPSDSVETTLGHELGHAVAGLADEYFALDNAPPYQGPEPGSPNVTVATTLGALKWAEFVRPGTQLPTVEGAPGVGLFEGARYRRRGVYRPSYQCLMRGPAPVFCAVCASAMQARIATLSASPRPSRPEITSPRPGATLTGQTVVAFSFSDSARVDSARLIVDGSPAGVSMTLAPFELIFDADALPAGRHRIAVEISLADGGRVTTPEIEVATQPRPVPQPSFASVSFKGGRLLFSGVTGFDPVGTVAVVDGVDRFPIALLGSGEAQTLKTALGAGSGLRLARVVRKGAEVALQIRTARGGLSPIVRFRR